MFSFFFLFDSALVANKAIYKARYIASELEALDMTDKAALRSLALALRLLCFHPDYLPRL